MLQYSAAWQGVLKASILQCSATWQGVLKAGIYYSTVLHGREC